jgi:hypothetical protein
MPLQHQSGDLQRGKENPSGGGGGQKEPGNGGPEGTRTCCCLKRNQRYCALVQHIPHRLLVPELKAPRRGVFGSFAVQGGEEPGAVTSPLFTVMTPLYRF